VEGRKLERRARFIAFKDGPYKAIGNIALSSIPLFLNGIEFLDDKEDLNMVFASSIE
jgi:hypothetical protein